MRVLFLLHEQYRHYKDEPAYTEVVKPFHYSGFINESEEFVFQRILRQNRKKVEIETKRLLKKKVAEIVNQLKNKNIVIYGAGQHTINLLRVNKTLNQLNIVAIADKNKKLHGKTVNGIKVISPEKIAEYSENVLISSKAFQEEIKHQLEKQYNNKLNLITLYDFSKINSFDNEIVYSDLEKKIFATVFEFKPDLIVLTLTYPGENIKGDSLIRLKQAFPNIKIYTQWWDFYEHNKDFLKFEQKCLQFSDMVGIIDSYTRFVRIRNKQDIYKNFKFVNRLHWHPTFFDPYVYKKIEVKKTYDIAIFGSAENERIKYINFLKKEFKNNFFHFGGIQNKARYISKEEYVKNLNKAKIFVNTQTYYDRVQLKGKIREALSCGTFILEEDNPETRAYVDEGTGVIYFKNINDLREKINFYLENELEREQIAEKGYNWFHKKYNPVSWVSYILKTVGLM